MDQFSRFFVLLSELRPIRNMSYRPSSRHERRWPRMSAWLPPLNTYQRDTSVVPGSLLRASSDLPGFRPVRFRVLV